MLKHEIIVRTAVAFLLVLMAACAPQQTQPVQQVVQPPPLFPPQGVIKSGDYAKFLAENSEALKSCKEPDQCTVALFNLSFLHCYSKSPYYDPPKGLKYLDDLIKGAPESIWAYQAMVWRDMVSKTIKPKSKKRQPREEARQKEAPEASPNGAVQAVETPQDNGWEADRQRLENEIKMQQETIQGLNKQIERSRQIDIEIEKKERGLLY